MKYIAIFFLLLTSGQVFASESTPRDSFELINACVKKDDTNGCKDLFTASSASLYDRFMSYGLMNCLPKDAVYFSEANIDKNVILRAKVNDYGKERYMRLLFVEEAGKWKLDVPQSLQIAMGKNWEKQVQMTEQIYLLMKQQLGADLNCSMIRGLVKAKK